jgi:hypothetical protein
MNYATVFSIGGTEFIVRDAGLEQMIYGEKIALDMSSSGFYSSSTGEFTSSGNYSLSQFIQVSPGDSFSLISAGSTSMFVAAMFSTNSGNAILTSVSGAYTDVKEYSYLFKIPSGVNYIRIGCRNSYISDILLQKETDSVISKIEEVMGRDIELDFSDAGFYSSSDGSFTSSQVYHVSQYIYVNPGDYYTLKTAGSSSMFVAAMLESASGSALLSSVIGGSSNVELLDYSFEIPPGVHYLRIGCRDSYLSNAVLKKTANKAEEKKEAHSISILFVGNSLTQDGIAYLPYLLNHYYPEIDFKFYLWYNGGRTLEEQYTYFTNNTPCDIFSVSENSDNWANYNSLVTMSSVLSTFQFDIVCLQDYFNYKPAYSTDSDMAGWKNCRDYITANYSGGNGLEFIALVHAPLRNNSQYMPSGESTDTIFTKIISSNNMLLQKTITDDLIANGIAVYRALSTDLDSLGDMEHLSPDGTHTQEGLPCLLQTYTTACWLFDKLGIAKSVYGCPMRITTSIYNQINVPGPNLGTGVITGTDAQNLLAQEVAIKAYKEGKYYVANNSFVPSN